MNALKDIIVLTLYGLGVFFGIYVGAYLLCIGGLVQVIEAMKANPVSAIDMAMGIFKFIVSGSVGWTIAIICFATGKFIDEEC